MATAKITRKQSKQSEQSEFVVKTKRVLKELLAPEEVLPGDKWTFIDGGGDTLVIVRVRETLEQFVVVPDEDT
jgi:hypothetical protein